MKLSNIGMRLLKDDFLDLTDQGMIQEWPEFLIEWLNQKHASGNRLDDIVYNKLIFRDKAVFKAIIKDEYNIRQISAQFDIDWEKYAQAESH